jgi:hypothetical protein
MKLQFRNTNTNRQGNDEHNVQSFFKVQMSNNTVAHFDKESHLREIMASYLDHIIGTDAVPPCVGYRLRLNDGGITLPENVTRDQIYRSTSCGSGLVSSSAPSSSEKTLDGSLMVHLEGLRAVRKGYEIAHRASKLGHDNAVRYSLFLYLAGCIKTDHNHFRNYANYVAIDNDRCFVPYGVYDHFHSNGTDVNRYERERFFLWESLSLRSIPCQYLPSRVLDNLRRMTTVATNGTVSSQLIEVSSSDVLWPAMKSFFPPAVFQELDGRVERLLRRADRCTQSRDDGSSSQDVYEKLLLEIKKNTVAIRSKTKRTTTI